MASHVVAYFGAAPAIHELQCSQLSFGAIPDGRHWPFLIEVPECVTAVTRSMCQLGVRVWMASLFCALPKAIRMGLATP